MSLSQSAHTKRGRRSLFILRTKTYRPIDIYTDTDNEYMIQTYRREKIKK